MYLTCPLCRDEWIITTRICGSCDKIRHYMEIYSQSKILEILDKVLVVQQHKDNKLNDKELNDKEIEQNKENCIKEINKRKFVAGNDSEDYEKPTTRNQKK